MRAAWPATVTICPLCKQLAGAGAHRYHSVGGADRVIGAAGSADVVSDCRDAGRNRHHRPVLAKHALNTFSLGLDTFSAQLNTEHGYQQLEAMLRWDVALGPDRLCEVHTRMQALETQA